MKKLLNHILVPVNLAKDNTMLMDKAIQVANYFDCDVHLLVVQTPLMPIPFMYDGHFSKGISNFSDEETQEKFKMIVDKFRPRLLNGLLMTSTVAIGNWYQQVKEQVITRHIDLVILPGAQGKSNSRVTHKIDVDQLAQQAQCPVLTVTEDFDSGHLHNIVVPVDDFLPIRKLSFATYLAKKANAVIHLMSSADQSEAGEQKRTRSLTRAYQLIKEYSNVKVYCTTQQGNTIAEDTLTYARNVKADLIVVNPGRESLMKGWFSKWIKIYLYRKSNIPVLTIAPQAY